MTYYVMPCPRCGGENTVDDGESLHLQLCEHCARQLDASGLADGQLSIFDRNETLAAQHSLESVDAGLLGACRELITPDVYSRNPFQVLGISVTAASADIAKSVERAKLLRKLAKHRRRPATESSSADDDDDHRLALQRLRDPLKRFIDELFWFWPRNGANVPVELSPDTDWNVYEREWLSQLETREDDLITIHNLAVLLHMKALVGERDGGTNGHNEAGADDRDGLIWRRAFAKWRELLAHRGLADHLRDRISALDDPRLTDDLAADVPVALPWVLTQINADLAAQAAEDGQLDRAQRHIAVLAESRISQELIRKATMTAAAPIRLRIEKICERARSLQPDPADALVAGNALLEDTAPHLSAIDLLLPEDDVSRQQVHDSVSMAAQQFAIAYGNETGDWEAAQPLIELALERAAGAHARQRIAATLSTAQSNEAFKQFEPILVEVREIVESSRDLRSKVSEIQQAVIPKLELLKSQHGSTEAYRNSANFVAAALRELSVELHNDAKDLELSLSTIRCAVSLATDPELKARLQNDASTVAEHQAEAEHHRETYGKPISSAPSLQMINGIGTTMYGDTHWFVFFFVPIWPIARYSVTPMGGGSYRFHGKLEVHPWQNVWRVGILVLVGLWLLSGM